MNGLGSDTTDGSTGSVTEDTYVQRCFTRGQWFRIDPLQGGDDLGRKKWSESTAFYTKPPQSLEYNVGSVYFCKPEMLKLRISLCRSFHFSLFSAVTTLRLTIWFGVGAQHTWGKYHVFVLKYNKHGRRCLEVSSGSTPPDVEKQSWAAVTSFGSIHHLPPLHWTKPSPSSQTKSARRKLSLSLMSENLWGGGVNFSGPLKGGRTENYRRDKINIGYLNGVCSAKSTVSGAQEASQSRGGLSLNNDVILNDGRHSCF